MRIEVTEGSLTGVAADWIIVPVCESGSSHGFSTELDAALDGTLSRLKESGDLSGKAGELVRLLDVRGLASPRLLLAGLGPAESATPSRVYRTLMTAVRDLCTRQDRTIALAAEAVGPVSREQVAELAATALTVGSSSQQLYRGEPERHPLAGARLVVGLQGAAAVERRVQRGTILGEAMNLTRELVNRHPGEVYPESFADRASQVATELGLACEVFDEPRLAQERMQSLLGVARGVRGRRGWW